MFTSVRKHFTEKTSLKKKKSQVLYTENENIPDPPTMLLLKQDVQNICILNKF